MKLLALGTGGYHPSETRHTACYLLPQAGVMLDAGTGLFRAGPLLEGNQLDLFLTHAHLDHVVGLTYLLDTLRGKDHLQVRIHGDPPKLAAVRKHLFARQLFPVLPRCEWRELTGPVSLANGGLLRFFPLQHPGGSLGFRIDWPALGKSLAYVTDTTASPQADYQGQIAGVDLLIHECNFPDGEEDLARLTGHSTASNVARMAVAAQVGRLLAVHVDPSRPAVADTIAGQLTAIFPHSAVANDGEVLDF